MSGTLNTGAVEPGDMIWDSQSTGFVIGVMLSGVPSRDLLTVAWSCKGRVRVREYSRATIEGFIDGLQRLRNPRKIARDL